LTGPTLIPALSPKKNSIPKRPKDTKPDAKTVEKPPPKPSRPMPEPYISQTSGAANTILVGPQWTIGKGRYLLGYSFNNGPESNPRLEVQSRHTSKKTGTVYARGSYNLPSTDEKPDSLTLESAYESPPMTFGTLGFHLSTDLTGLHQDAAGTPAAEFRLAPIFKTPAVNLPGIKGVRLGFSPQLRYNTATQDHSVVLRAKVEWSHRTKNWSGGSVEAYASVDKNSFSPLGIYAWAGGYAPNIFGKGKMLIEGGAWVGAGAFKGLETLGQAFMAGLMLKITFSGSASGFEPGRYNGM
jgi:hypothetical protein